MACPASSAVWSSVSRAIFVAPVAALLHDAVGSWLPVFIIVICLDVLTALLALFVLKPLRRARRPVFAE